MVHLKVLFKGREIGRHVAKKLHSFDHFFDDSEMQSGRSLLALALTSLLFGFSMASCAAPDERMSTVPESAGKNARAHPAVYGIVDTFYGGAPQKVRPANDFLFYFKECEMSDPQNDRAFFSKTAYSCTGAR